MQPHHLNPRWHPPSLSQKPPCFSPRYAPSHPHILLSGCVMLCGDLLFACLRPSHTEDCFGLCKAQPSARNSAYMEKMNARPGAWQVGRCLGMGSGYGTISRKTVFPVSGSCCRSRGRAFQPSVPCRASRTFPRGLGQPAWGQGGGGTAPGQGTWWPRDGSEGPGPVLLACTSGSRLQGDRRPREPGTCFLLQQTLRITLVTQ